MTEQELIKIASYDWHHLEDVEDKALITKKVIDNIRISNRKFYHRVLKGVNPECISKEKALQLLKYDKEMYGLLTKELQEDKEILEVTTCYPDELPESLFNNREGIKYVLDRYNVEGKSWCAYGENVRYLIIKPDINKQIYCLYPYGVQSPSTIGKFLYNVKDVADDNPCMEAERVANKLCSSYFPCYTSKFVQHLN